MGNLNQFQMDSETLKLIWLFTAYFNLIYKTISLKIISTTSLELKL